TNIAAPDDVEFAYNRIQVFVAIVIGSLTASVQYLKYKQTSRSFLWKKLGVPTIVAAVLARLVLVFGNINYVDKGVGFLAAIWVAVVAAIYAAVANLLYFWVGMKGYL